MTPKEQLKIKLVDILFEMERFQVAYNQLNQVRIDLINQIQSTPDEEMLDNPK